MTTALPDQLLPPLLFGAFAEEIDPLWRHLQVLRQQDAIRQTTGDDTDLTSSAWLTLKTHQRALGDSRRACATAARAVVGRADAWPQFKPGQVLFDALCTAQIRALRAEYDMAKALGQLTDVQAARLLSVLEAPDDARRPDGDTLVADLALLNPEGNEVVPGVMLITHRDAVQNPTAAYDVLMHWPGAEGGLVVFDSLDHLKRELLMWLDEAVQAQTTLSLAPIVGHAFEVGLARQWRRLHGHALAIDAGERLYDDAPSPEASRQRWQQEAVASLSAARHDARDQAFADLLQEHTASDLARGLPAWMTNLAEADRDVVDQQLSAYLQALGKARQQLQRDVAPRDEFVATRLAAPLQRDFGLQPEQVLIDLPVSVEAVKEVVSEGGTPGTPSRQVNTPSRQRETLTLTALALAGVDKALATRLHFAHVQGVGLADTARLPTVDQLKVLCAELDVPALYEQTLRDAFMGPRADSTEAVTARRQVLLAPWHASLALHTTLARLRGQLDAEAVELVGNAGARLYTVGLHRGPNALDGPRTTLGSVTLICHPEKPLTVLHLPDAPNGKVLTAHASPEAACTALAGMALESGMVDYLATQPVVGNPAQQAGYLRQALLNNFSGFVFPGEPLATAASLAERQLNIQMGRIITQHRASARSQDTLWLEAAAQGHAVIFPIIKVFIGLVPFVGTAVGLYDAFENAMAVVDAWANGRAGEGLDQMENLLAALVGAAMDVLPGLAAGNALKVRSAVRTRQAANARRLTPGSTDGLYGSPFRGYESELTPSLLRNAEDGVFSHADQHYIVRAGTAYAVQWDATYRTWRLRGTAQKTYRQPVVRDADGNWNTHGAVHGRLVSGGLEGGGGVLTHVADQMVERLPLAVQRRLPRWLGDAQAREQRRIHDRLITEEREVSRLYRATEWARQRYVSNDEALRNALLKVALEEVQACDQLLLTLGQQRARLPDHIYRNTVRGTRYQAMGRIQNLIRLGKDRLRTLSANYARIQDAQGDVIAAAERGEVDIDRFVRTSEDFLRQARELRVQLLEQADFIDHWSARFEKEWHSAALDPRRRTDMERVMRESDYRYQPRLHQVIKAETLLKLVLKDDVGGTPERVELARLFARDVRALNALLTTWRDMGEVVNLSGAHRKRLLEQFASEMEYFRWRLEEWTGAYPEQIDLRYQKGVLRHLKALRDHALADLARDNPTLRREQPEGGPRKRVFETVDDRVLIGIEQGRGDAQIMQVDLQDGSAQRYQRQANGKWRLQEAAALQQQLSELQAQARVRLDKSAQLVLRAEGYGRRGMALASVEDLVANEGRSLQDLARQIERLSTAADDTADLVAQLRARGQDLTAQATLVRVRLSKTSQQPTMAYVEYLLDQRQVRLERRAGRVPEGFEGQSFLQEYVVVELATGEDLWFAHFHYQKQRHGFDAFTAAHLKRADQRLLGAQWEAQQAAQGVNERVWRSPISLAQARRHFEPLG